MRALQSHYTDLLEDLARRFEWHGKHIYANSFHLNPSPLYTWLSLEVAADPDILVLVANADMAQQVSNLLFGAVHLLLLGGVRHPIAKFYPDLGTWPLEEAYPFFRAFCLEHAEAIEQLATTRQVQTNEVQRCASLLPAAERVLRGAKGRSFMLIEIGSSAGLKLLWDHYGYDYGKAGYIGNAAAPIQLHCTTLGDLHPPLPRAFPSIVRGVGIDLTPVDVQNETATHWLRALIWPEHRGRARLPLKAVEAAHPSTTHNRGYS